MVSLILFLLMFWVEPLNVHNVGFYRPCALLLPSQQNQTNEWNSEHWPQLRKTSSAVAVMGDSLGTADVSWNDMGWKVGGLLCSFWWGELGPHLTQCRLFRGLPPYQVASWSIQPFVRNTPTFQTDRTRHQSHSIGRTVTCNGRPATHWPYPFLDLSAMP